MATRAVFVALAGGFGITFLRQFLGRGTRVVLFLLGPLLVLTFQGVAVGTVLILAVLGGRANLTFQPIRDHRHFVRDVSKTFARSRGAGLSLQTMFRVHVDNFTSTSRFHQSRVNGMSVQWIPIDSARPT